MNSQAHEHQPAGLLLIISGPSGVGKTTITHRVEQALDAVFSVSMTTRPRTTGDRHGADYHFVDRASFEQHREAGDLLEWAEVFGNYYGTPRAPVERAMQLGKLVILEIDVQGAVQVKRKMPEAFSIFILPPDEQTLLARLRSRGREDESVIQRRFAKAQHEIEQAHASKAYDAFVVNEDLEQAVQETIRLVREAQARRSSNPASGVRGQ